LKRSSSSPDANIPDVPGINVLETEFIAGLMDHLQAVAAFVMPTMASYERLMDGAWAVNPPYNLMAKIRVVHMSAGG